MSSCELRSNRLVVIVRLLEIRKELNRRLVGGIVVGKEDGLRDLLGFAVVSALDKELRIGDARLAELGHHLVAILAAGAAGGNFVDSVEVVQIGTLKVLVGHGFVALCDKLLGNDDIVLTACDFAVCKRINRLREGKEELCTVKPPESEIPKNGQIRSHGKNTEFHEGYRGKLLRQWDGGGITGQDLLLDFAGTWFRNYLGSRRLSSPTAGQPGRGDSPSQT